VGWDLQARTKVELGADILGADGMVRVAFFDGSRNSGGQGGRNL
jgi:hypothetical protein